MYIYVCVCVLYFRHATALSLLQERDATQPGEDDVYI